jgi:hypothetical protein
MKPRDYCCCAIPLVNAGIYAAIIEQFVLGILAGTLSVATPSSQCMIAHDYLLANIPSCSCWCSNTLVCPVVVCYNMLYRRWYPSPRIFRRIQGEFILFFFFAFDTDYQYCRRALASLSATFSYTWLRLPWPSLSPSFGSFCQLPATRPRSQTA